MPHCKPGDYDGAVEAGVERMIAVVGEPLPILLIAVLASGILRSLFGRWMGSVTAGALAGGSPGC